MSDYPDTPDSYIIDKIISGGQTGVDRAALDAARSGWALSVAAGAPWGGGQRMVR